MNINNQWHQEIEARCRWIDECLYQAGAKGVVLGLSGGKDSSVVAALARRVTPNTLGLIMPCGSISTDRDDALRLAQHIDLETIEIDIQSVFEMECRALNSSWGDLTPLAMANIKPRLRMISLYAVAQTKGYLVAGTSNRSERIMGYFTKWGDAGCDFNPIADLTVREVLKLGAALNLPQDLVHKPPSAGLWVGQTDENEMGISYAAIDAFLLEGVATPDDEAKIRRAHAQSKHKRDGIRFYKEPGDIP